MKRRLDLAAALIHNPQVLFLDEPTTGLDPASRASVWAEVRRLNAELGMTIFLTTQYLEEADALADRVGIISRGRLVAEGTPDALKRSVGQDLIVAEVTGDDPGAPDRLEGLPGIDDVSVEEGRITISTSNGPATLSPVALSLGKDRPRGEEPDLADADAGRRLRRAHRFAHRGGRVMTSDRRRRAGGRRPGGRVPPRRRRGGRAGVATDPSRAGFGASRPVRAGLLLLGESGRPGEPGPAGERASTTRRSSSPWPSPSR